MPKLPKKYRERLDNTKIIYFSNHLLLGIVSACFKVSYVGKCEIEELTLVCIDT